MLRKSFQALIRAQAHSPWVTTQAQQLQPLNGLQSFRRFADDAAQPVAGASTSTSSSSSSASGPKSMLDSSIAHSGAAGDALGSAARIAATKAAAEAEDAKAHPARRAIGVLFDALLYGSLGVGAVAGVTYWKYGASEVEDMLKGIEESKEELSLWDQARAVFFVQYLKVAQPLEKMVSRRTVVVNSCLSTSELHGISAPFVLPE